MLSVMPELNCAASVGGVEINTSECGPLNWEHLCPSGRQLQGLFGGHLELLVSLKAWKGFALHFAFLCFDS